MSLLEDYDESRPTRFKRNLFLTELTRSREFDEEYMPINIVNETVDRLLYTSETTLQQTLLLRKQSDAEKINAMLDAKKAEFSARIAACAGHKHTLMVKQQSMKEECRAAAIAVEEQEMKRRRALRRCELDTREREKLNMELERMRRQAGEEAVRRDRFKDRSVRYRGTVDFLDRIIHSLPKEYIESSDDPLKSLMDRHTHLTESECQLKDHVLGQHRELNATTQALLDAEEDHGALIMDANRALQILENRLKKRKEKNEYLEMEAEWARDRLVELMKVKGNVMRGVDCLIERSGGIDVVKSFSAERISLPGIGQLPGLVARSPSPRHVRRASPAGRRRSAHRSAEFSKTLNGLTACTMFELDVIAECKRQLAAAKKQQQQQQFGKDQ